MSKFPRLLSTGANNKVIVLNEKEVAKLFLKDSRSDLGSEAEKMQVANTINDLVVIFHRLDFDEILQAEMLVMERLYPMDYRAYEVEKRELWLKVFLDKIRQLHNGGFVHRHIKRATNLTGLAFDNILLTDKGLRLIDTGTSVILHKVGDTLFKKYQETEETELQEFANYFLNR